MNLAMLTTLPLVIGLLSSCSLPGESPCKKAMRQVYLDSTASGTEGKKPKECNGVADDVLADYAMEILQEEWEVTRE